MEKEAVTAKAGVKNLLDELDKMYLKDGKFSDKWNLCNIWAIYAPFKYEYFWLHYEMWALFWAK